MPIKTKQIVEEAHVQTSSASPPATGSGKGSFFVLDIGAGETEAAFADEAGNVTQITNAGALNLGGIQHNTLSGLTTGDPHTQYHNNTRGDARYYQKTEFISTSAGAGDAGKPVVLNGSGVIDASMVTGGSGETNTASNLGAGQGVFSAKVGVDLRFKSLVAGTNVSLSATSNEVTINATGGGGGLGQEFKVELGAGSSIADKVSAAISIPSGWTIVDATNGSVAAELQSGGTVDDIVFIHGETLMTVRIDAARADIFGGFLSINTSNAGDIKNATSKNQVRLKDFNTAVGNNTSTIYIKMI